MVAAANPAPRPEAHDQSARAGGPTGRSSSSFERATYAKAINRGYGDAMGRGLELALTLVVVGGIGWLVDRIFGTYPTFTVIFALTGFAGITVKLWLGYDLEMRQHEAAGIWNRPRRTGDAASDGPDGAIPS
jgi:uncharacterized membrane protein YuzA (DUF378 family)